MREYRKVIAINEETGERREFHGTYAAAVAFGVNNGSVISAINSASCVRGWRVFDDPERIRERIKDLEAQIEMLEG